MHARLSPLAAALIVCIPTAWANASASGLPTHETYAAAADFGSNFFDPAYTQLLDATTTPGASAQIIGAGYAASASTSLSSNHAYASATSMPSNVLAAGSFSGWYDQVTITGGSGTGTAHFTVQLNGSIDVGAIRGMAGYGLMSSSLSDLKEIGCKFAWPVHISPLF